MNVSISGRAVERAGGLTNVRWEHLALVAIALLPVVLSLPFLGEPMEKDESVYFSVVLSGDLPYVDVFDHKPPVIYGWYGLSLLLSGGGPSIQVVHFLAGLQLSATALAVAWIGTLLAGRRLGLIAGFLMALTASNQYLQFNGNTEVFMILPLTLSLGSFVKGLRSRNTRWFLLAGALGAFAAWTKAIGVLNLAALIAALVWAGAMRQLDWPDIRRWSLAVVGGAAVVTGVVVAPFVVSGHLGEFWHANVTYNLAYSDAVPFFEKLFSLAVIDGRVLTGGLFVWVLAAVGAVLICARHARVGPVALLASAVAACAGAALAGRGYSHYWVALTPFAALLAGMAVMHLTQSWDSMRRRLHVQALFAALALPTLIAVLPLYVVGVEDAHRLKFPYTATPERAIANRDLADHIASLTGPEDEIYVLGAEAQLYVLSDRRPAAYYIFNQAFEVEPETFDQALAELRADPPALIVDASFVDHDEWAESRYVGGRYRLDDDQLRRFGQFLDAQYEHQGKVAYAQIYLRK